MSITNELLSRISWEYHFGSDAPTALSLLQQQPPLQTFSKEAIALCKTISSRLTHDPRALVFPDLMALGYALRSFYSSNVKNAYADPSYQDKSLSLFTGVRLGRGLAFHFAPNNVEILFLYSLFLSILAGNTNIVRLGQKQSLEQQILLTILKETLQLPEHQIMAQRILLVRYGHDDEINALFSKMCNLRIIWGGNDTVEHLRRLPIQPSASELAFAHKFSWAVLSAQAVINAARQSILNKLARDFVTDAFSFGQQACSSPRLIVWLGKSSTISQAQNKFWQQVDTVLLARPFELSAAQVSERFTKLCHMACSVDSLCNIDYESSVGGSSVGESRFSDDNCSVDSSLKLSCSSDLKSYFRVGLNTWTALNSCRTQHSGNGVFLEIAASELSEVLTHCSSEEQTITSFGITSDEWKKACVLASPHGLCRIVPIGKALAFNAIWDGHDLIAEMSRKLSILL